MPIVNDRRDFLKLGLSAAAVALVPRWAGAQQSDPAAVPVVPTKLADNLYLLQGAGGNMALHYGPDGVLLVDSSFAPAVPRIRAAIAALVPASTPAGGLLVNTHWHGDHTGGNEGLHAAGFRILAHRNTRLRLSTAQTMKLFHQTREPLPPAAWPTAVFDDAFTLYCGGDTVNLKHIPPAHTDTDITLYWERADVLHTGDLFFNGVFPVIDESSGGSIGGMIAASQRLLQQAGPRTKIIPGHGPLAARADLERYRQMLETVRDKVAALKAQGLSEQEVVAKDPTADYDATLGRGFMKSDIFTGVVYRTL